MVGEPDDVSILVHMFSVFFMKAYRKPREFGWLSGMAHGAASVFGFSGYLRWMSSVTSPRRSDWKFLLRSLDRTDGATCFAAAPM
jgi:hypothetical protein